MSTINKRSGTKLPDHFNQDQTGATTIDPGPHIGKIKANRDPASWGRVHVFIPSLGGDESDPKFWRIVGYASPFFGATSMTEKTQNRWDEVAHTYGMWATVPDIDNFVLCVFVNGDPNQGYYFACLPNQFGHHMVPGIASSKYIDQSTIQNPNLQGIYAKDKEPLPVAEFNEDNKNTQTSVFEKYKVEDKPIHEPQALHLVRQGLDRFSKTQYRGYTESTSQRESPSTLFGISTPGALLARSTLYIKDYEIELGAVRAGGHSFIMDDGFVPTSGVDADSESTTKNNLVRLRSSTGHQILMDDSRDLLYIINNQGTGYIEIMGSGHINIYAQNSVNLRTGADINFHADNNINFNAKNFNFRGTETVNIEAGSLYIKGKESATVFGQTLDLGSNGEINISAKSKVGVTAKGELRLHGTKLFLNSGPGNTVTEPNDIEEYKHTETTQEDFGQWVQESEPTLLSISPIVPTHEPWKRTEGDENLPTREFERRDTASPVGNEPKGSIERKSPPAPVIIESFCGDYYVKDSSGNIVKDGSGKPVLNSAGAALDSGPKSALSVGVSKKLPRAWLLRPDAPNPTKAAGPLSLAQTKALMGQIAYTESNWRYQIRGGARNKFLGRYQFGGPALATVGFIKNDWAVKYKNDSVDQPGAWTGKMGVKSAEDYLANPAAQEAAMLALLESNYSAMTRNGAIKNGDDICCVGGMLSVAHLIGPGDDPARKLGAKFWRRTGEGSDANQTTGTTYYNRGRYAVHELAQ